MNHSGRFVVLGGGISGLSAAYRLIQKLPNSNVTIIESSSRLGGWIQSKRYEDGTIFELGPRGLRPAGASGVSSLQLAYELGLENQVVAVPSDHVSAQNRFIYAHNKLHKLPSGIIGLLQPQTLLKKNLLGVLLKEMFVPKAKNLGDETIHGFISRRFNQEVANYIIDPMCRGIFAGDIKKLSMKSCLPPVYSLEESSGSVVKGLLFGKSPAKGNYTNALVEKAFAQRWSQWTLKNGIETLAEALEAKLLEDGANILRNKNSTSMRFVDDGSVEIRIGQNEIVTADHVFSSIPTKGLAALLPDQHSSLADLLRRITAVTAAVVNIEFEGSVLAHQGFGYLYPSSESAKVLGVIFDSCTFPHADSKTSLSTRITVILGGHLFQDQFGDPENVDKEYLKNVALDAISKSLDIRVEPRKVHVSVHKDCIPQYYVGHSELVSSLRNYTMQHSLPLDFIGSWYDGVGLNDCIYYSQCTVDNIVDKLNN